MSESNNNPEQEANDDMRAIAGSLAQAFETGGVFEGISSFAFEDDDEEYTKERLERIARGEEEL